LPSFFLLYSSFQLFFFTDTWSGIHWTCGWYLCFLLKTFTLPYLVEPGGEAGCRLLPLALDPAHRLSTCALER
jgi:hypothetical protein